MTKQQKIRDFVKDVEAITLSKVIGLDFISLDDDDGYFYQDYLLHSNKIEAYLKFLDENYFSSNPSLLLTGLKEKIKSVIPSKPISKRVRLIYDDPKIPKDNFKKGTTLNQKDSYYWDSWCNVISNFYPYCNSIYFIKEDFNNLVQTTALFIYFNTDISSLDKRRKGWLTKTSKAFLYEEAVNVFLPKHIIEIRFQSVRAAISQVMARNSSHNIGSHVLNKLTGNLNQINLAENIYISIFKDKTFTKGDLLDQISKFNNYIKCRMDYLSDITFGIPAMHISKRFKSEVLNDLDEVRLLLENISGLSDFKYSINIDCEFDDDPAIAMPNDILGNQAFYNIVENVIRNTAKHSDKKNIDDPDKIVRFTIEINLINTEGFEKQLLNQTDLLYEVNIYDNIIVEGDADKLTDDEKKEYLLCTKTNTQTNISKIDYLVYSQNKKLNDSILKKEDNTLRSTSLGLIEMEASACYLRKLDVSNLEDEDYNIEYNNNIFNQKGNINILKAIKIKAKTQEANCPINHYLGYRFFLLKPTEVLLIGEYQLTNDLKNSGILQLSFEEFEKQISSGKIYNHQFLVHDSKISLDVDNSDFSKVKCKKGDKEFMFYNSLIPKRYFQLSEYSFNYENSKAEDLLNYLWQKWAELNPSWSQKNIENSVCQDNPKNYFIFLNHTKEQLDKNIKEKECFENYFIEDESHSNYIEPLSSVGQHKLPGFSEITRVIKNKNELMLNYIEELKDSCGSQLMFKISLKESASQEIVVIDERVQSAAYDKNRMVEDIMLYKYFQHTNLFLPSIVDVNLSASDFIKEKNKLEAYLEKNIIKENINKKRFLLIHYSLIERLYSNKSNKINAINDWFKKYSQYTTIIVTSGRGTPPELPEYVTYLNLSPVLAALLEFRSKFYLHQIIMSSRKTIRK